MDSSVLPSEFQALLRDVLRTRTGSSFSSTPLHTTEGKGSSPGGNGRFKKVIDSILFSKKFILTYQLVLIALLLAFTVVHWSSRLQPWRRKRRILAARTARSGGRDETEVTFEGKGGVLVQSRSSGSSSSSSTLAEDTMIEDTILERPNEQTSLLRKPRSINAAMRRYVFISKLKAWVVYQPRPIPILNKTLPSNGASLAVVAFIGLQIFYTFFNTPLSLSMLFVFADRTSLLFVANLPLLYLFAAKNQPLKLLTGYSYEGLNIIHRRLGEVMCLLALLHSIGMIGVWYTILRPVGMTLVKFLLMKMILLGIGAFVAYELIYFTSLGSFRQRWYELFLGLHVILQAAALILVWFHHHGSRPYVGAALAIFLIDRLVYRMFIKRKTTSASLRVMEDEKTVALCTQVSLGKQRSVLSYLCGTSNIAGGWKTTEHVFLTVPSLAHKHIIQAHPFTVASKAPSANDQEARLELLIRAQNGFSADLLRYARNHHKAAIKLDGPYGSQSAFHMLRDSDNAIVVAGGSGIAVTWPLISSLLESLGKNDLENLRKATDARRLLFVWVIREQSHLSWLSREKLETLEARGVTVKIPPRTADNGHPDVAGLIADWVDGCRGRTGVVASGPDGLNRSVRNTCSSLIRNGYDVNVEIEKFGW